MDRSAYGAERDRELLRCRRAWGAVWAMLTVWLEYRRRGYRDHVPRDLASRHWPQTSPTWLWRACEPLLIIGPTKFINANTLVLLLRAYVHDPLAIPFAVHARFLPRHMCQILYVRALSLSCLPSKSIYAIDDHIVSDAELL